MGGEWQKERSANDAVQFAEWMADNHFVKYYESIRGDNKWFCREKKHSQGLKLYTSSELYDYWKTLAGNGTGK